MQGRGSGRRALVVLGLVLGAVGAAGLLLSAAPAGPPLLRELRLAAWVLLLLAFALWIACFDGSAMRASLCSAACLLLALFISGRQEAWAEHLGAALTTGLVLVPWVGFLAFSFLAIRAFFSASPPVPSEGSDQQQKGKLRRRTRLIVEMVNLGLAAVYPLPVMLVFQLVFRRRIIEIWPVFVMFLLGIAVFVLGYVLNTRLLFRRFLLPPEEAGRFLLAIHVVFYSTCFLLVWMKLVKRGTLGGSPWADLALVAAWFGVMGALSFLGTWLGSARTRQCTR